MTEHPPRGTDDLEVPDHWPRSVLKVRADGVRGPQAAQAIAAIERIVADRAWKVSRHEDRETWIVLHVPAGRSHDGEALPPALDRAAYDDVVGLVGAVGTASVTAKRSFVLLLDDEEVGTVSGGRPSTELERDVLAPWRRQLGL